MTGDLSAGAAGDVLTTALHAAGLDVRPLPRLDNATAETVRAVSRGGPVLFAGLAADWPATSAWTPEKLTERYGREAVTALVDLPADGVLFPQDQQHYERTLPLGEFIEKMMTATSANPCYLAYTPVTGLFSSSDYDFDSLLEPDGHRPDTRVWVGSAGTRAILHSDPRDNLFCQLYGEKSVVLVPWEHSPAIYPFPDNIANSRVDLANLDLARIPKLREAVLYSATLRPGDVVLVPRGCWHDIRSHSPSVSLNHWFGPRMGNMDYARMIARLGQVCWAATARDAVVHGVFRKREKTLFFFSPASTGKRVYRALLRKNGRT